MRVGLPVVEFKVLCSRGTYLRSMCHDLGRALGNCAHLTELRRLASGDFSVGEAVSPGLEAEGLAARIIPLEEALARASMAAQKTAPEGRTGTGRD